MKKNKSFLAWLKTQKDGKAHLMSTSDVFTYDEYTEDCVFKNIKPAPEESAEFYNWCNDLAASYWEDDLDNMRTSWTEKCGGYLITGNIGRWDGIHEKVPVIVNTFDEVINHVHNKDINDIDISYDTEGFHILAHHHDSTNVIDVHVLKKDADLDKLHEYIDNRQLDMTKPYYRRFITKINDFLF